MKKAQFIGRQLSASQRKARDRLAYLERLDAQLNNDFKQNVDLIIEDFEARRSELQDLYKFRLDRTASTKRPIVCVCQSFYGGDELKNFIDYTR